MSAGDEADGRSQDLKFRISEAALDLFVESGFDNVSVDAIAGAVGVSRRTVFRYFKTKLEIPFPDHSARQKLQRSVLASVDQSADPVDILVRSNQIIMGDFLAHSEIVLKRYRLSRIEPAIREREIVENARYTANGRAFLRSRLDGPDSDLQADVFAAMLDAVFRTTLRSWARSEGRTDPLSDLVSGFQWVLSTIQPGRLPLGRPPSVENPTHAERSGSDDSIVVVVMPANSENLKRVDTLVNAEGARRIQ